MEILYILLTDCIFQRRIKRINDGGADTELGAIDGFNKSPERSLLAPVGQLVGDARIAVRVRDVQLQSMAMMSRLTVLQSTNHFLTHYVSIWTSDNNFYIDKFKVEFWRYSQKKFFCKSYQFIIVIQRRIVADPIRVADQTEHLL